MKKKISVCIPCFSTAENIKNCVESLIKSNNNKYTLDIFLYNNSNKDEIIYLCKELSFEHENIRLIDYRTNRGVAVCWNDAIEHTYIHGKNQYSLLLIVNDDIIFKNDSVVRLIDYALNNLEYCTVRGSWYSIFTYSRMAFEKVGFFDENLVPAYFEDADFLNRCQLLNQTVVDFEIDHDHLGSQGIPANDLRNKFEDDYLPKIRSYYRKKWDNPVFHTGFPINYSRPFNRFDLSLKIPYGKRKDPYLNMGRIFEPSPVYEKFEELKSQNSDNNEHLEVMFQYAKKCINGMELGFGQGRASFALLLGLERLYSVDTYHEPNIKNMLVDYFGDKLITIESETFDFVDYDSVDLLLVDSVHTYDQVKKELKTHSSKINKYIMFHDTVSYGAIGQDNNDGIVKAINEFLEENKEWKIIYEVSNNHGFMILEKINE